MPLALRIGSTRTSGTRRHTQQLAQHLRAEGHACELSTPQPASASPDVEELMLALSGGELDIALVACTALPTMLPDTLTLAATLPRDNVTPCLVSADAHTEKLLHNDAALLQATHPLLAAEWRAVQPGHLVSCVAPHTLSETLAAVNAGGSDGVLAYTHELNGLAPGTNMPLPAFHHPAASGVVAVLARCNDTSLRDWLMRWHSAETLWMAATEQSLVAQMAYLPLSGVKLSVANAQNTHTLTASVVGFSAGGVRHNLQAIVDVEKLDAAATVSIANALHAGTG